MAHVLSVLPRMIHPALSGGELRVKNLMRRLRGRHRFTLALLAEGGAREAAYSLELERELGVRVVLVKRTPGGEQGSRGPDLARAYHDPAMTEALPRLIAELGVDLAHLEFTQMGQYARAARGLVPVVFTEHDASILKTEGSYERPGCGPAPNQGRLSAAAYLKDVLASCDRIVAVSSADAERLAPLAPAGRVRVVPTGVDLKAFPFRGPEGRGEGRIVFVGHYAHYPNEDAAVTLAREVLPRLRRLVPGARLSLVGSGVTPAVDALRGEGVEVTGPVADVQPHLARARAFVAPLRLGSGIKGKLLEAFASGTPVAATPQSCEAMPGLRDGEHALLSESPEGLAEAARRLLLEPELSARLARAARAYVEERFGWDAQADLMDRVYEEAAR